MDMSHNASRLHRSLNEHRVENARVQFFVPEKDLDSIMTEEVVTQVIEDSLLSHRPDEVVRFVMRDARKIFAILVLINQIPLINRFICGDQLQMRCLDHSLPFTRDHLHDILKDDYAVRMFYEKQWEFSIPRFSGQVIRRELAKQTVLPYLVDKEMTAGGYGTIYRIEFHPSYRPQNFENTTTVSKCLAKYEDSH